MAAKTRINLHRFEIETVKEADIPEIAREIVRALKGGAKRIYTSPAAGGAEFLQSSVDEARHGFTSKSYLSIYPNSIIPASSLGEEVYRVIATNGVAYNLPAVDYLTMRDSTPKETGVEYSIAGTNATLYFDVLVTPTVLQVGCQTHKFATWIRGVDKIVRNNIGSIPTRPLDDMAAWETSRSAKYVQLLILEIVPLFESVVKNGLDETIAGFDKPESAVKTKVKKPATKRKLVVKGKKAPVKTKSGRATAKKAPARKPAKARGRAPSKSYLR